MPSPFPAELFEKAKAVQETLSELYFRISLDHDFLVDAYRDVVKADKVGKINLKYLRKKYFLSG